MNYILYMCSTEGGSNMQKLYTVKDLQCELGLGRDKAYQLMHNKTFPAIKIGGRYFVTQDALDEWLRKYQYKTVVL